MGGGGGWGEAERGGGGGGSRGGSVWVYPLLRPTRQIWLFLKFLGRSIGEENH